MKTRRRRNVSEDGFTITERNKRSKKTTENERRENSLPIPIDLIMEIFLRLSAKSIARCRCVSKPWDSILGRSDFKELFSTRSSARPQLLFVCETDGEVLFFSSPQPQNPDENSSPLVVNYHMKFSFDAHYCYYYSQICRPVHGLVCFMWNSKLKKESVPVIYNPSTGQSLLLPKVKTRRVGSEVFSLLGYDPIDKQLKLLSMIDGENKVHEEHQVLTLGTRNHSWRMIKCCKPLHYSYNEGICINGVLYYIAWENSSLEDFMVVCFDVRSEKFRFTQVETFDRGCVTINYNGKLALLASEKSSWVSGNSRSIELRVLEDVQKHEWSKHTYLLPARWKNIVGNDTFLYIVGMTQTNEIVLAARGKTMPFYVFYYNIERKTTRKLQIQGMVALNNIGDYRQVFLNHVEDLKLI